MSLRGVTAVTAVPCTNPNPNAQPHQEASATRFDNHQPPATGIFQARVDPPLLHLGQSSQHHSNAPSSSLKFLPLAIRPVALRPTICPQPRRKIALTITP